MGDEDTSYRKVFDPPPAASRMANVRFGNPQDVVVLFEDDNTEEKTEYIRGLLFIAVITFMLFMAWGLCLCIFMCLGKERVGYLSGRPFVREQPRSEDERYAEEEDQNKKSDDGHNRKELYRRGDAWGSKASTSRMLFLFSGVVVIIFSILLVQQGLVELQTTVDTAHDNSVVVQRIAADGRQIIASGLQTLRSRASSIRDSLLNELNRDIFCPEDTAMENSDIARDVRTQIDSVVNLLEGLEDFQDQTLTDLDDSLLSVSDAASSVERTTDDTDMLGWISLAVLISYTSIAALLMAATVLAFFDVSFVGLRILIDYFLLPIFILMTVGACALASITAVGAGMNSDFCLPNGDENASPDANVVDIMLAEGYVENDFELAMIRYYVYQCTAEGEEDPFSPLKTYLPDLRDNEEALSTVVGTLRDENQLAELAMYCNREFHGLDAQLDNMKEILSLLVTSLEKLLDLLSCGRIVPIYTDTIYEASCAYSPKALFWIFCSAIILATFGLTMITFRASYKLTVVIDETNVVNGSDKRAQLVTNQDQEGVDNLGNERWNGVDREPARPHDPPPEEIRVDEDADEVYTAYTGHYSEESAPMNYNDLRYMDDDTVTREKKAQAIDVD